ncbi:MAG: GGDEF domain-containing protein [Erysipelotrichia bacterium]|nr:GGDEF domain-containing protein [Erysipelotrichia bacterium]NCC55125.1 GGDEF domain-containing protein [Erysipelotrichia bacterium]
MDQEKEREQYLLRISNIDKLTGTFNRRAYEADLEEYRKSLAEDFIVVSLDLNGLKEINDLQGHQVGDDVLQRCTACINDIYSPYGKIYRVGGDEFIAFIHIDKQKMIALKEELYKKLEEESQSMKIEINISCGYCAYIEHSSANVDDLIMLADKNMYKEKALYYKKNTYQRNPR